MDLYSPEKDIDADEEIFFGKLSLKEIKKHIFFNSHRQSISCMTENNKLNVSDESIKVIETHSEPDIYSVRDDSLNSDTDSNTPPRPSMDWDIKSTDDSFLKLEKMVTDICDPPKNNQNEELDNTLEAIENILNNASLKDDSKDNIKEAYIKEEMPDDAIQKLTNSKSNTISNSLYENKEESKTMTQLQIERLHDTPPKTLSKIEIMQVPYPKTPGDKVLSQDVFKTPKNPVPLRNCLSSTKKTPGRINAYQHITSPVASYIKSCPQVPLLKEIHPKKPLPVPGCSSIPKLVKNTCEKNKENVALPSIAYRNAKMTRVITVPDKVKLPQNSWANKLALSLKKPLVIRHDHRESTCKKVVGTPEDNSFADLSLHQADLSVCTQKSALS